MRLKEAKHVTSRLIKVQEAIRKKYRLMKEGRTQLKLDSTAALQPITDLFKQVAIPPTAPVATTVVHKTYPRLVVKKRRKRLKHGQLFTSKGDVSSNAADEEEDNQLLNLPGDFVKTEDDGSQLFVSNPVQEEIIPTTPLATPKRQDILTNALENASNTPEGQDEMDKYLRQFHLFVRPYLRALLTGDKTRLELDKTYGPKVNANGSLSLGSKKLTLDRDYIYLGDNLVKAPITEGLLNLLFLQRPLANSYSLEDKVHYRDLLWFSNVAHQGYSKFRPYNTSGHKYKYLLKDLLGPRVKTGKGFIKAVNARARYVFFDNPNEIIDRLRLLLASKQGGNNIHDPEIHSIFEELEELGIIV